MEISSLVSMKNIIHEFALGSNLQKICPVKISHHTVYTYVRISVYVIPRIVWMVANALLTK